MNENLIQAVEDVSRAWLGKLGIISVADVYDPPGPGVLVLVDGDLEAARRNLPRSVRGFPVVVKVGHTLVSHPSR
jgi:hypothetical protein